MNVFKDFIQNLRKLTLTEVYIIVNDDIVPNLLGYVHSLNKVKFEEFSYHTFYGEVKQIMDAFLTYYNNTIDRVLQQVDKCSNVMNRDELLVYTQKTIDIHYDRHIFFGKNFLPVCSTQERETYEAIEAMFNEFKDSLVQFKNKMESFDKQDKVDIFAKDHFIKCLQGTSEMFDYTHGFLSIMLADRLKEIKISIEEILLRIRNNIKAIREECGDTVNVLMNELYDKNKEFMVICRQPRKNSVDLAEVGHAIQDIREKIEDMAYKQPIRRVSEELLYWETRLEDFSKIADNLLKMKAEQENVRAQQEIYNKLRSTELPGSKRLCWLAMGTNFQDRQEFLKVKILEVARTLLTFFAVRGYDYILYSDDTGQYYLDCYNHRVYVCNDGLNRYHVNCDGYFKQVTETDKYYFDKNGRRYIHGVNGERVYQRAPCTSSYRLANDNLLMKITPDCGHSESDNKNCSMRVNKDQPKVVMLPELELKDIKSTLDAEVVEYLWRSFGHVLPRALHDAGRARARNPVQQFAHSLLLHKYSRTFSQLCRNKKEAQEYRLNIYKERKEKAMIASKAWKAKQVKRRKPEESDDTEYRTVYNAYNAAQDQIVSLNYYYE